MSNEYRAKWKDDSIREAEVEHFKQLKVAQNFLNLVVKEATEWAEEKHAAIEAGMDPAIAMFGHRACGVDAFGNPLPDKTATDADKPAKKSKPRPYKPRVYAPQMMVLGARAATLLLDLVPLILGHWKRLVNAGIDPRRLALENSESKMAALLFDEIGVQYRDLDAGDYDRVKAALDQIEAWIKKTNEEAKGRPFDGTQGRGGPETGPPEVQAATSTSGDVPPLSSPQSCESAGKPAHSKDSLSEDSPSEESAREPRASTREAAPYSANGNSLDWTRL